MTYLHDKRKKNRQRTFLGLLVFVAAVSFFGVAYILRTLSSVPSEVFNGTYAKTNVLLSRAELMLLPKSVLVQKVTGLQDEVARENAQLESYDLQKKELAELKSYYSVAQEKQSKIVALRQSIVSPYGTFTIQLPNETVSLVGAYVTAPNGITVGTIVEQNKDEARVLVFDHQKTIGQIRLLDSGIIFPITSYARGVMKGTVPTETLISVGDKAILDDGKQFILGYVVDFSKDEKNPTKEVYIQNRTKITDYSYFLIDHKK